MTPRLLSMLLLPLALSALLPADASAAICNGQAAYTKPDARYTNHGDGTVTDRKTGLMWKRCHEGETWSGTACVASSPVTFTWQGSLQRAQQVNANTAGQRMGRTDWRVPNFQELASLIEDNCESPAINATYFGTTPGTATYPYSYFWTSSPGAGTSGVIIDFNVGTSSTQLKTNYNHLRLVRSAW